MANNQKKAKGLPTRCSNATRKAQFQIYRNEDRDWHSKLNKLARRIRRTGLPKYRADYDSVLARAPAHVRLKHKSPQKLAA